MTNVSCCAAILLVKLQSSTFSLMIEDVYDAQTQELVLITSIQTSGKTRRLIGGIVRKLLKQRNTY
jgi:hypothetical protein